MSAGLLQKLNKGLPDTVTLKTIEWILQSKSADSIQILVHTIQMDIRWGLDPTVGLRHNWKAKKNNMLVHEKLVLHQVLNDENDLPRYRIMVLGTDVQTVQTVSCYCLDQGVEVLPY
jgi:hypothetical protein